TDDPPCNTLTGACNHPPTASSTPCTDTDGIECTIPGCDGLGSCNQDHIDQCQVEICRTPGFWGTHAGTEKNCSQDIAGAVLDSCGGLTICGHTIDNTDVPSQESSTEAICVTPRGDQTLQLARQLTAAGLNCCVSGGGNTCNGISIQNLFADC